ncbi:MAG: hypothetical protein KGQ77_08305 [Betaproteobacteria bacterium]|nr:hypothetical protein [Betaproteobacteria bacterium]
MSPHRLLPRRALQAAAAAAVLLAGCAAPPRAPAPAPSAPPPQARSAPAPAPRPGAELSSAASPRDYRRDGARHLYARYPDRVFKGMMPPMLPAIGVVDVRIDKHGNVANIAWVRAPSDRSYMSVTEHLIRGAAPFPVPTRLGSVTYTDVWLWDRSGKFQLDTLTEGQRSE